jgi:hypothetical protein
MYWSARVTCLRYTATVIDLTVYRYIEICMVDGTNGSSFSTILVLRSELKRLHGTTGSVCIDISTVL